METKKITQVAWWLGAGLIAGSLLGLLVWRIQSQLAQSEEGENSQKITTVTLISVADLQQPAVMLEVLGKVEAAEKISVVSQIDSTVKSIAVVVGDNVEKGAVLVRLDTDSVESKVGIRNDANASLDHAEFGLNRDIDMGISNLKTNNEYAVVLAGAFGDTTSKNDGDENSDIINTVTKELEATIIRAPFTGEITDIFVAEGDSVKKGQIVLTMKNPSGFQVSAFLSLEESDLVVPGAEVTIEGGLVGSVASVATKIDPATKKIKAVIAVESQKTNLIEGQYVYNEIRAETENIAENTFIVPLSAVAFSENKAEVYTITLTEEVRAHTVVLGKIRGSSIEVIEGLDTSMKIVNDVGAIKPGQKVKVR